MYPPHSVARKDKYNPHAFLHSSINGYFAIMKPSFTIPARSSTCNAVLAVLIQLFIILLAQDVYREHINFLCRGHLMKGGAINLYRKRRYLSSILFGISILVACVVIELGVDGRSLDNAVLKDREIRPKASMLLTNVANWTDHEHLHVHPAELSLLQFPNFRTGRLACASAEYFSETFFMIGDECFDSNFHQQTPLLSVFSYNLSQYFQIGASIDTTFSSDFGTLSFRDQTAGRNQTVNQLSVNFHVTTDDPHVTCAGDRGIITFSVLQNWNYSSTSSNCSTMDSIFFIFQNTGRPFFYSKPRPNTGFGVICFNDVFQPALVKDVTDLVPQATSVLLQLIGFETFSLQPENRFEPKQFVNVRDEEDLAAHKLFFALSKLHFVKENIIMTGNLFDYVPYMVSIIDNRLSSEEDPSVTVRLVDHENLSSVTDVQLYSVICFSVAILSLLLLKIAFIRLKKKAPFEVRVFDTHYLASLNVYKKTLQLSAHNGQGPYEVYLMLDVDNVARLRLRRKCDELEEAQYLFYPDMKSAQFQSPISL